jgi:hypothetical protein
MSKPLRKTADRSKIAAACAFRAPTAAYRDKDETQAPKANLLLALRWTGFGDYRRECAGLE